MARLIGLEEWRRIHRGRRAYQIAVEDRGWEPSGVVHLTGRTLGADPARQNDWCKRNCSARWFRWNSSYYEFESDAEAIHFMMAFSE